MKKGCIFTTATFAILVFAAPTILTADSDLSNAMLGVAGTKTVPYDQGPSEDLPSAAARICGLKCSPVAGGCSYAFDIEVFETCWKSIHSIRIEELVDTSMEPLSCPMGWSAQKILAPLRASNVTLFWTETDPIQPGTILSGFAVVSYSARTVFRWHPADNEGILVGRASRLELGCATGAEPETWGSIKATYR